MFLRNLLISLILITPPSWALKYDPGQVAWNLNQNEHATDPLDYSGSWQNHVYNPSPTNWRMPFYTIMLDRFVNGNPTNDDANGTQFEFDHTQTQLRHGGDIQGLRDSLDYLQGMGIKVRIRGVARPQHQLIACRLFIWLVVLSSTFLGQATPTVPWILRCWTTTLGISLNGNPLLRKYTGEGCMW